MKKLHFLATSAVALAAASASYAGGYAVPIIDVAPPITTVANGSPNWAWLAVPVVVCAIFCRNGDSGNVPPPGDYGGPCFREGTVILTGKGWVQVENLKAGDIVSTSKGPQPILHIDSWVPTEFKDRPAIVDGVYMSANHCVELNGHRVPAAQVAEDMGKIDGARYFHILTEKHAWLMVGADVFADAVMAETLFLTEDIRPLAAKFPGLSEAHAADPCAPLLETAAA